jgi:hypothetical protein
MLHPQYPIGQSVSSWRFKLILTGIKYLCTKTLEGFWDVLFTGIKYLCAKTLEGFWDVLFMHTVCADVTWTKRLMGSDSLGFS